MNFGIKINRQKQVVFWADLSKLAPAGNRL